MTLKEAYIHQLAQAVAEELVRAMPEAEPLVVYSHTRAVLEMLIEGIWRDFTIRASGMIDRDGPVVYTIHDC